MLSRTIAALACLALAVSAAPPARAAGDAKPPASAGASCAFTAQLDMQGLSGRRGGQSPAAQPINFSGKLYASGGKFRLELNNGLTQEQQIYIVDNQLQKAWMLYPDTLTGVSSDLASLDHDGVIRHAQQLMDGGSAAPQDWGKADKRTETLSGKTVTRLTFTLPKGRNGESHGQVNLWQAADQTPVKLVLDRSGIKVTVNFSDFQRGVKPAASLFTPDKKYNIHALAAGEAPPLPGAFGNGSAPPAHGGHS
jgi:hypothetical protein